MTLRPEPHRPLLVASNRLPVVLEPHGTERGEWTIRESSGGLATALRGLQKQDDFLWVGWPGHDVRQRDQETVDTILRKRGLVPIFLTGQQRDLYYNGFCNGVIWPLFHYFQDRVDYRSTAWASYEKVNRMFAQTIANEAPREAKVWIQDFQLMLVPRFLRELRPDLEILFFLHIPFPSSEIYRSLPVREDLLLGLLGADYVGFHTSDYSRHFRSCCLRVLGLDSTPDGVAFQGRRVGIGNHPIGIPTERFRAALETEEAKAYLDELRAHYEGRKLLLGVERLDYTKGIPLKIHAYEEFLRRDPERAKKVVLVQLIVPSRLDNPEYQSLKQDIDELVGRVNGNYGMPGQTPIEYLHRSLDVNRLAALYAFSDAALVTPVRDGMNLVAQEFVLCQAEHSEKGNKPGALVLSEFAGAAHSLSRAILVNPWDVQSTATAIEDALAMAIDERGKRIRGMAEHVDEMDCEKWAAQFLSSATRFMDKHRDIGRSRRMSDDEGASLARAAAEATHRILFLDYDGTLREFTRLPSDAKPTKEIRTILADLAALPNTEVHVVSGRDRRQLSSWLGDLPLHLCAEHGFVARTPGEDWRPLQHVDLDWLPRAEEELRQVVKEVPGSLIERKPCSVAWHYRMADLDYGSWRARELCSSLDGEFANQPVEVLLGHKVLEVRAAGVNKGSYVRRRTMEIPDDTFVLAIGDDRTDLDMYAALPEGAVSIHLGEHGEGIDYWLENAARVRTLLRQIAASVSEGQKA